MLSMLAEDNLGDIARRHGVSEQTIKKDMTELIELALPPLREVLVKKKRVITLEEFGEWCLSARRKWVLGERLKGRSIEDIMVGSAWSSGTIQKDLEWLEANSDEETTKKLLEIKRLMRGRRGRR